LRKQVKISHARLEGRLARC